MDRRHATWRPVIGRFGAFGPKSGAAGCMSSAQDTWLLLVGRRRARGPQERRRGAWAVRGTRVGRLLVGAECAVHGVPVRVHGLGVGTRGSSSMPLAGSRGAAHGGASKRLGARSWPAGATYPFDRQTPCGGTACALHSCLLCGTCVRLREGHVATPDVPRTAVCCAGHVSARGRFGRSPRCGVPPDSSARNLSERPNPRTQGEFSNLFFLGYK